MMTAEQHREFMAVAASAAASAAAFDSDLDFANRFQLEDDDPKTVTNPQNDVVVTDAQPVYIPHGEGSSKHNEEEVENDKVFRVYFKGIVSEERVGNKRKLNLAGIGVAICDCRNEVVFMKRKAVDVVRGERVGKWIVEVKALLEALNSAIVFGVKRAVLCFDYHTLFQQVNGLWRPKQQKIQTFVDEVNLLLKKFTHCEPSLIAKKDMKRVYKLAREAISSQIKAMELSKKIENCEICFEDKSLDQFLSVKGCNHEYCCDCMKQHVEGKLHDHMLPTCPHEGCEIELTAESCESFLTSELGEMLKQILKEASVPVTEKFYCPYPECSTLMSKSEVRKLSTPTDEIGARKCNKCLGYFCVSCRVPWHKNMGCAEYKRRNPNPVLQESKLKNMAANYLWRQCFKCQNMIELAAGCFHITCRCGYEFCYRCGSEWKNKKATCNCPLWVEVNLFDPEFVEDDNSESDEDDNF